MLFKSNSRNPSKNADSDFSSRNLFVSFSKSLFQKNKSSVNANTTENENFDQISVSGGVIDLYKAAQYAYDNFYNKKGVKANKKAAKSK